MYLTEKKQKFTKMASVEEAEANNTCIMVIKRGNCLVIPQNAFVEDEFSLIALEITKRKKLCGERCSYNSHLEKFAAEEEHDGFARARRSFAVRDPDVQVKTILRCVHPLRV